MAVSTGTMTSAEFRALAEFRYQIRIYLNGSEEAARNAGLEPQQYLLMLALRGLPLAASPASESLPNACNCATTASWNWWIAWNAGRCCGASDRGRPPPGDRAPDSARRKNSHEAGQTADRGASHRRSRAGSRAHGGDPVDARQATAIADNDVARLRRISSSVLHGLT